MTTATTPSALCLQEVLSSIFIYLNRRELYRILLTSTLFAPEAQRALYRAVDFRRIKDAEGWARFLHFLRCVNNRPETLGALVRSLKLPEYSDSLVETQFGRTFMGPIRRSLRRALQCALSGLTELNIDIYSWTYGFARWPMQVDDFVILSNSKLHQLHMFGCRPDIRAWIQSQPYLRKLVAFDAMPLETIEDTSGRFSLPDLQSLVVSDPCLITQIDAPCLNMLSLIIQDSLVGTFDCWTSELLPQFPHLRIFCLACPSLFTPKLVLDTSLQVIRRAPQMRTLSIRAVSDACEQWLSIDWSPFLSELSGLDSLFISVTKEGASIRTEETKVVEERWKAEQPSLVAVIFELFAD